MPLGAGEERAVAATKTYTAELLALNLLVRGLGPIGGDPGAGGAAALGALPARRGQHPGQG